MKVFTIHVLPNQQCTVVCDDSLIIRHVTRANTLGNQDFSSLAGVEPAVGATFFESATSGWKEVDAAAYIAMARWEWQQFGDGNMPAWMQETANA